MYKLMLNHIFQDINDDVNFQFSIMMLTNFGNFL